MKIRTLKNIRSRSVCFKYECEILGRQGEKKKVNTPAGPYKGPSLFRSWSLSGSRLLAKSSPLVSFNTKWFLGSVEESVCQQAAICSLPFDLGRHETYMTCSIFRLPTFARLVVQKMLDFDITTTVGDWMVRHLAVINYSSAGVPN